MSTETATENDATEETVCAACGAPLASDEASVAHLVEALHAEMARARLRAAVGK